MDLTPLVNLLTMIVMLFNICNSNDFNRKQCMKDWDVWLFPEIQKAWDLYTEQYTPYQEERDALEERETGPS